MRRILFSTVVVVVFAALTGLATTAHGGGEGAQTATAAPSKLTICHKTGSGAWRRITVSSRARTHPSSPSGRVLRGHLRHVGDAVVVGTAACPSTTATPAPTNTPAARITICHKTGSTSNPFRRITISSRAVTRPQSSAGRVLRGHMAHTGDLLMPGMTPCPAGTPNQPGQLGATLTPVQGATGSGSARFSPHVGAGRLCYTLTVTGLTNVTAAHIHRVAGGAIVVPLTAPTSGTSTGCVEVERDLLMEILQTPSAFYVNVHTSSHPNGQVQGTLRR